MAIKKMSVAEYVNYRVMNGNKITQQAVTKAIRLNHRKPGIVNTEMYGGTYILHVNIKELDSFLVSLKKPLKLHSLAKNNT